MNSNRAAILGGQEGSYLRGAPFLSPKPPINPGTLKVRACSSRSCATRDKENTVRIVKKNKNNLPICLRYGYVIKYGLAKKFKILERRKR